MTLDGTLFLFFLSDGKQILFNKKLSNSAGMKVGAFENDNSTRLDDQMSASLFLRRNETCLKSRDVRRPRSRSFSEPGDERRNMESDFCFAAHLHLDRQTLLEPKKKVDIANNMVDGSDIEETTF